MPEYQEAKTEMEQPKQKVVYNNLRELVTEWQQSNQDCSLWNYLGLSEEVFKTWIASCKSGNFDN